MFFGDKKPLIYQLDSVNVLKYFKPEDMYKKQSWNIFRHFTFIILVACYYFLILVFDFYLTEK